MTPSLDMVVLLILPPIVEKPWNLYWRTDCPVASETVDRPLAEADDECVPLARRRLPRRVWGAFVRRSSLGDLRPRGHRDETGGSGWFSGVAPRAGRWIFTPPLPSSSARSSSRTSPRGYRQAPRRFSRSTKSTGSSRLPLSTTFNTLPFHIIFNLMLLWFFAATWSRFYGTREFARTYLTAAVEHALLGAVDVLRARTHRRDDGRLSGQVTGCSGLLYYPRREILLFFVPLVEMWLVLVIFLGLDALVLDPTVPRADDDQRGHRGGIVPEPGIAATL